MNNIPSKLWNAFAGALILLAIFLAIVSIKELKAIRYVGSNPSMTNTLTVDGNGDAVSKPDVATFNFTVTENAKTVAEAQTKATEKTNAALKAMKDGGVAERDIQTISYNINPHYEYQSSICSAGLCPPSRSILTGYDVSETVSVKVRDLGKAGTLFSSIGSLGVQNVNGLTFSVDNPDSVQAEARAEAILEAQEKAQTLARQLNVSLVRIVSFNEYRNDFPRRIYGMGGDMAVSSKVAAVPEIAPGEQKTTVNVSITYEIK